jgi:phage virion morphogenesis protein
MAELEYNLNELDPALERMLAGLEDKTELMLALGEMLIASTQERIEAGESPDGTPFAPRSPTTLKRYAKLGLSFGKPLNQSGDMRRHLHYEADADRVAWGSSAIQSAVMHFGAKKGAFGSYQGKGFGDSTPSVSIPWGDIPARPFVGVSQEDETNISAEIIEWLEGLAVGD